MGKPNLLAFAIWNAAESWPNLDLSGDPNLKDVYYLAGKVAGTLHPTTSTKLPDKATGVEVVERVESTIIRGTLVRTLPPLLLSDRGLLLVKRIRDDRLLDFLNDGRALYGGAANILAAALYAWHGCLNMAKTLRRTYATESGEEEYTLELRKAGYDYVKGCSEYEAAEGNPWVRFGMTLAHDFSLERNNQIEDSWVPTESPYWN